MKALLTTAIISLHSAKGFATHGQLQPFFRSTLQGERGTPKQINPWAKAPLNSVRCFAIHEEFVAHDVINGITSNLVASIKHSYGLCSWKFEVLNDFSHLMLDLLAFLTPETAILRLAEVIGRISSIAAIQYATTTTEEILFQLAMFFLSVAMFSRSIHPLACSLLEEATFRDHAAYVLLFRPAGMSWIQYRTVLVAAGEWMTVPPDTEVVTRTEPGCIGSCSFSSDGARAGNDHLYWLYRGDAEIFNNTGRVQYMHRSRRRCLNKKRQDECGLLYAVEFSRTLEARNRLRVSAKKENGRKTDTKVQPTMKSGQKGATFLRLNTQKLLQLMEDDKTVEIAIQGLLLRGFHERLEKVEEKMETDTPLATQ